MFKFKPRVAVHLLGTVALFAVGGSGIAHAGCSVTSATNDYFCDSATKPGTGISVNATSDSKSAGGPSTSKALLSGSDPIFLPYAPASEGCGAAEAAAAWAAAQKEAAAAWAAAAAGAPPSAQAAPAGTSPEFVAGAGPLTGLTPSISSPEEADAYYGAGKWYKNGVGAYVEKVDWGYDPKDHWSYYGTTPVEGKKNKDAGAAPWSDEEYKLNWDAAKSAPPSVEPPPGWIVSSP